MSLRKKILISGAGRLACRHIEGLTKSKHPIELFVYDISNKQLNVLGEFFNNLAEKGMVIKISYWRNLCDLANNTLKFDMTIVASTANNRHSQLEELFELFNSDYWLIEKPLSQSLQSLADIAQIKTNQNVWVNHFRRMVPWHQKIKKLISHSKALQVTVESPHLGIACNISHYVDLMMFWTNQRPVNVNTNRLERIWINSKRPTYFEINGEIAIQFSNHASLKLISGHKTKKDLISGQDLETKQKFEIDEINGVAKIFNNRLINGSMLLQSEMTGVLLDELISTTTCKLTSLDEAIEGYGIIVESLNDHWNECTSGPQVLNIPIT